MTNKEPRYSLNSPSGVRDILLAEVAPLSKPIEHTSDECRRLVQSLLKDEGCEDILVLGAGRGAYGIDFILNGGKSARMIDRHEMHIEVARSNIAANNCDHACSIEFFKIEMLVKVAAEKKYDAVVCGTSWIGQEDLVRISDKLVKPSGLLIQTIRSDFLGSSQMLAMNALARKDHMQNIYTTCSEHDEHLRLTYCVRCGT